MLIIGLTSVLIVWVTPMRNRKILLSLSTTEEKRLQDLVKSYRLSGRKVTMSDVLRQALFSLPTQPDLFSQGLAVSK